MPASFPTSVQRTVLPRNVQTAGGNGRLVDTASTLPDAASRIEQLAPARCAKRGRRPAGPWQPGIASPGQLARRVISRIYARTTRGILRQLRHFESRC